MIHQNCSCDLICYFATALAFKTKLNISRAVPLFHGRKGSVTRLRARHFHLQIITKFAT